jgi:hypothetical protein
MSEVVVQNLFGEVATQPVAASRKNRQEIQREKAKRFYEFTAESWKNATYQFAVETFLPANQTFIFEQLTLEYDAIAREKKLPPTVDGRAFAGLQNRLKREGLIEAVPGETRIRTQGSPSQVYRSLVWQEGVSDAATAKS